jgi:L-ascorbate metabolism protein UlaG (beta-lactamase superfamily)
MADGFKRACPDSFAASGIGALKIDGYPSYEAVMSCGTSPTTNGKTSETAAVLVIFGKRDVYTLQWAARTAPSDEPMDLDLKKWKARLDRLKPVDVVNPM